MLFPSFEILCAAIYCIIVVLHLLTMLFNFKIMFQVEIKEDRNETMQLMFVTRSSHKPVPLAIFKQCENYKTLERQAIKVNGRGI